MRIETMDSCYEHIEQIGRTSLGDRDDTGKSRCLISRKYLITLITILILF